MNKDTIGCWVVIFVIGYFGFHLVKGFFDKVERWEYAELTREISDFNADGKDDVIKTYWKDKKQVLRITDDILDNKNDKLEVYRSGFFITKNKKDIYNWFYYNVGGRENILSQTQHTEQILNDLGNLGWEVISVSYLGDEQTQKNKKYFLKRKQNLSIFKRVRLNQSIRNTNKEMESRYK